MGGLRLFLHLDAMIKATPTSTPELQEALDRYREIFDFAPIGYVTLETVDTIADINHWGAQLLGVERNDLIGTHFNRYVAPASRAPFDAVLMAIRIDGAPAHAELELLCHAGPVPVRLHATALRGDQATVLLAFEDISDRREKEIALARTEHALREEARHKDEFLGVLSHELRSPLSPIRMSVAVLEMLELPPTARESLEIVSRSTEHLTRLVDDLLDITRITRGKISLVREIIDLNLVAQRVVAEHASAFSTRGITLEMLLQPSPVWVHGDAARLVQIVSNLLTNAEKFTPPSGRVSIAIDRANGAAVLGVRDSGIGIAPDVIGRLGMPFVQAPQALDRSAGGLGLGLAMVRSLAGLHGGSLAIHSAGLGLGTEVFVSLPEHAAPATVCPTSSPSPVPPRRILIIEDNPDAARSLSIALTLQGHVVEVAPDGRRGVACASEQTPQVVICDLGLPDLDGFTVARLLREEASLRDVALVALSGYARPEDVARSLAAGFDRHLAKPPDLTELESILRNLPLR